MSRPAEAFPPTQALTIQRPATAAGRCPFRSSRKPSDIKLPFDLPSSMAAVEANRPDVPFDTADPLFRFGHGLRYAD
jgi:beta-glucosidase